MGGSATNDGGAGMLQALGLGLLDTEGQQIPADGAGLAKLDRIDLTSLDSSLADIRFDVACDVDNPLIGDNGVVHQPFSALKKAQHQKWLNY